MVRLKRKRERIMSICFTWFPIVGLRKSMFHLVSYGSLGKLNIQHQSVWITRKWEDCGDCLTL